ncbi:hypothetical protein BS78_01G290400 [Paspalum vaginatum]|nr:hypothetical protein BS78_01G290400 [Paspalum vaginatum]
MREVMGAYIYGCCLYMRMDQCVWGDNGARSLRDTRRNPILGSAEDAGSERGSTVSLSGGRRRTVEPSCNSPAAVAACGGVVCTKVHIWRVACVPGRWPCVETRPGTGLLLPAYR